MKRKTKLLFPVLLLALLTVFCSPLPAEIPTPSLTPVAGTESATEIVGTEFPITPTVAIADWFQVYFTSPSDPHAGDYTGGPDEALAAAIGQARLSLDVAVYSFNLWSIRDAILDAWHRGVTVRMVMESDNMEKKEVQELIAAGIPIRGDQREGLMHDKFVVIDRQEVWTGSMNFTVGGAYKDNNNLVHIRSAEVAQDYTHEFEEMFLNNLFGPDSVADTPFWNLTFGDTQLEIYFSPDDDVRANLEMLIQGAQKSIYFMAYNFTSNELGEAIRERAAAGVTISGVMDNSQVKSSRGSEYDPFIQAGLDVRLDGNPGLMHHKVIIIDRSIVVTGSYNFTASAETTNDENLLVIYNPDIAAQYLIEFARVYGQAQP
jgi:phosphatidylserine/phosphatidylglycerophosphate/cardiolipin synthase-like enzyme